MKVIGHAGDNALIVYMSRDELAMLHGVSSYELTKSWTLPNVGTTFDVNKAWESVQHARRRPEVLKSMANSLVNLATQLEDMHHLATRQLSSENNNAQSSENKGNASA